MLILGWKCVITGSYLSFVTFLLPSTSVLFKGLLRAIFISVLLLNLYSGSNTTKYFLPVNIFQSRKRLYNHQCPFVRSSVSQSVTKTPKQHKINHFTLPQPSPPLTPHTTSHTPSHTTSCTSLHTPSYNHSYKHLLHHHPLTDWQLTDNIITYIFTTIISIFNFRDF